MKAIPSRLGHSQTLRLIQGIDVPPARRTNYFMMLKSLTESEDTEISEWLGVSEKTLRLYKNSHKYVKPALQEQVISILSLFTHGREIFGSAGQFKAWLKKENLHFNRKAPVEFMGTISGIKFIDDRLTGLEYGDNA